MFLSLATAICGFIRDSENDPLFVLLFLEGHPHFLTVQMLGKSVPFYFGG